MNILTLSKGSEVKISVLCHVVFFYEDQPSHHLFFDFDLLYLICLFYSYIFLLSYSVRFVQFQTCDNCCIMSYRSSMIRLLKCGAVGVVAGASLVLTESARPLRNVASNFSLSAKSGDDVDYSQVNNYLYRGMGSGPKWDKDWDKREPSSMVKPLKENASDEEKTKYEEKLAANTSKANRILVLVRHGQYNQAGDTDEEHTLTELGRRQADVTGQRLALLYARYLQRTDQAGKEVTDKTNFKLVKSSMTRATETANIILERLPSDIQHSSCDLIREGPPCPPEPPLPSWSPEPHEFYQEGARIEAAFRKYFYRAEPSQEKTSVEVLVCHGNVIR